jgi:preprotein translocase subunit SecB
MFLGVTGMAKKPIKNAKNEKEAAPKPIKMQVLAQYIRDMSFENILAQKGINGDVQPEISVQVNKNRYFVKNKRKGRAYVPIRA